MSKTAFIFPGQGSQHIGMGIAICDESSAARDVFNEASDVLGYDMHKLCKQGHASEFGRLELLFPAILTVGVASYRTMCDEMDVQADFLAGHSLGEYTALVCGGAVRFSDMLKVARKRGQLAQTIANKGTGYMSIIDDVSVEWVQQLCDQFKKDGRTVSISAYNSQSQVAICGLSEDIELAENELIEKNATITPLFFSPPFHSSLMQEIVDELREVLCAIEYHLFSTPVIANIDARPYPSEKVIVEYLCRQIVQPVQWKQTLDFLAQAQVSKIFDMGPQAILANLVKQYKPTISSYSFAKKEEREALRRTVPSKWQRTDIKGGTVYNIVTRCMAMAVSTCNRNDNDDEYQSGVIYPYEQLQVLQRKVEESNTAPTEEQICESLAWLYKILETKRVPLNEQLQRYEILFSELNFEVSRVGRNFLRKLYEENSNRSLLD